MKKAKWWGYPTYPGESYAEFTAGRVYEKAIAKIEEREAILQAQRAFITKHAETLAGLEWTPDLIDLEIQLTWRSYRGQKVSALGVARLWPDAKWKRVKTSFSAGLDYDWKAKIDGITLVIDRAETEEPRPKLKAGETIDLWLGEVADDSGDWSCAACGGKTAGDLEEGRQCIDCGQIWYLRGGREGV